MQRFVFVWFFFLPFTGLANQNLTYDDGIIMINYTHGETCHKIYNRSTAIVFSCDHSKNPVWFIRLFGFISRVWQVCSFLSVLFSLINHRRGSRRSSERRHSAPICLNGTLLWPVLRLRPLAAHTSENDSIRTLT